VVIPIAVAALSRWAIRGLSDFIGGTAALDYPWCF
jgi:hypothetical protein